MRDHTPGPWVRFDYRIFTMKGEHIDQAIAWTANNAATRTMRAEANARLIAAAPDLLESCREIEVLINTGAMDQFDGEPWIGRLITAIRKAEGQ